MPIANCLIAPRLTGTEPDAIVAAWASCSGVPSDEMTVNLMPAQQGGKRYAVMAWLYVPSLWSPDEITTLGEGLAAALTSTLAVEPSAVQVVTSVVPGGSVVEGGQVLDW